MNTNESRSWPVFPFHFPHTELQNSKKAASFIFAVEQKEFGTTTILLIAHRWFHSFQADARCEINVLETSCDTLKKMLAESFVGGIFKPNATRTTSTLIENTDESDKSLLFVQTMTTKHITTTNSVNSIPSVSVGRHTASIP